MTDDEKRKLWRQYHTESSRISEAWRERGYQYPPPRYPPFPDELRGLACGAKTRAGTPCKLTSIYLNGRCKFHGGLSTGPRTVEGKAKSAQNGHKPGEPLED
ncbi:HGGxSTG domain-containing protein [Methylococcus sp. EFPC2]|uniref:HGGxSTG domain-containing protein n=1 Tax=Methylococcus sp. EFPC2 TaxID=2812648 RepID=UPI00196866EF|nr:HGGxSTG domain-containing protein [Methylococcus sp. EFPC2]QSA97733.1 hypothetical protein JWZ97_02555 [Methylococcus sp. EFPC2]